MHEHIFSELDCWHAFTKPFSVLLEQPSRFKLSNKTLNNKFINAFISKIID